MIIELFWKQLLSHKILRSAICCFVAFLLFKPIQAIAQNTVHSECVHQIAVATGKDWVGVSPDSTKMVVVETEPEYHSLGKSLKIYQLNAHFKQQKLIFEDNKETQFITEFRWIGNVLFYSTIEGFTSAKELEYWLTHSRPRGLITVPQHMKVRTWPPKIHDQPNFKALGFFPPGNLNFFAGLNNTLLAFDPIEKVLKLAEKNDKNYSITLNNRLLDIYQLPQGKLLNSLKLPLQFTGSRWWSQHGDFLPLFMSKDGKKLVAMVSSYFPWRSESRYEVPFIITIDLQNGEINAITPDSEQHGLRSSGDLHYFEPGNPMPVDGGTNVVFNLNMARTINDIIAYFAYYTLDGKKIKEVTISKYDLQHAGIPAGLLLTWTPDGKKVLFQSRSEVWLYDIENRIGKCVASGVWIEDIVNWIDDNNLLIRMNKVASKGVSSSSKTNKDIRTEKEWGILSLP